MQASVPIVESRWKKSNNLLATVRNVYKQQKPPARWKRAGGL